MLFKKCRMEQFSFYRTKQKQLFFREDELFLIEVNGTSLKGCDISDCVFTGASFTGDEFRGCAVSFEQAVALSKILGIIIK